MWRHLIRARGHTHTHTHTYTGGSLLPAGSLLPSSSLYCGRGACRLSYLARTKTQVPETHRTKAYSALSTQQSICIFAYVRDCSPRYAYRLRIWILICISSYSDMHIIFFAPHRSRLYPLEYTTRFCIFFFAYHIFMHMHLYLYTYFLIQIQRYGETRRKHTQADIQAHIGACRRA